MQANLHAMYESSARPVVTAHRGFSALYPENTMLAFSKASELGADIIEFDVRESSDGECVIIHDATLDRTTNGVGRVDQHTLAELKQLNASYWQGPHDSGARVSDPVFDEQIPTLEEVLKTFGGKLGLNIQVKMSYEKALEKIVRLYVKYGLEASAFLMLQRFEDGALVRSISPDVAICIGEDRTNINRHLSFGVDYMQPTKNCLTADYLSQLIESRIPANVFYANERETMEWLMKEKLPGIMTDMPDLLLNVIATEQNREAGGRQRL